MDEQLPNSVTSTADDSVGREDASRQGVVSLRTALRRSAVGLALGALLVLAFSWIHSDGLLAICGALIFLHRQDDRRSRSALGAALLTAVPAAFAAAVLLKGWLPQPWDGILFAGLGALLGSATYAAVTQIRSKTPHAALDGK
ncbi:hypothetical protein [Micromonospora sp. DT47]|uniref:hypothetical protein n=1 Tax=Micromonospora sp. DT47 TaxID=3393431 RepID=UPI003CF292AA